MIELTAIRDLVTIFGVIAGFSYYVINVRANQKNQKLQLETRQMQLFMQIYNDINSRESLINWAELNNLTIDYEEYLQKHDSTVSPEYFAKRASLWYSYNTIGELLRLNMIEPDLLARLNVDTNVIVMYENWEHIIKENRTRENMPDLWDGFEYLYNEMKKIRESKNYPQITYNK